MSLDVGTLPATRLVRHTRRGVIASTSRAMDDDQPLTYHQSKSIWSEGLDHRIQIINYTESKSTSSFMTRLNVTNFCRKVIYIQRRPPMIVKLINWFVFFSCNLIILGAVNRGILERTPEGQISFTSISFEINWKNSSYRRDLWLVSDIKSSQPRSPRQFTALILRQ